MTSLVDGHLQTTLATAPTAVLQNPPDLPQGKIRRRYSPCTLNQA